MFERYRYSPTVESMMIRGKLRDACNDPLNAVMEFCRNMNTMIRKGDVFYAQARYWLGGRLTLSYQLIGGNVQGVEDTIFTEPQSHEYCEQYYLLHPRVPVTHPDARYDIKKILKMRVNAETEVCVGWFISQPLQHRTLENVFLEELQEIRFYWQAQNISHPIVEVYKAITEIVQEQKLKNITYSTNQVYSFVAAGQEIINVMVKQQTQPDYIIFNISSALASIAKHYIHLATEPTRLIQAQALHEINDTALTPFMALEMTSRTDSRYGAQLFKVLSQNGDLAIDRGVYLTFDQMPANQLAAFNVLMNEFHFNATHAINFLDYAVDFNYKLGITSFSPDNVIQAAGERRSYMDTIRLLEHCSPYNATSIVSLIIGGMFREQLEIAMQPCANMAMRLEHSGFHIHNILSHDYHARVHELQDQYGTNNDTQLIMITSLLSFIMAMMVLAGIYRVTRPLVRKCFSNSSDRNPSSKSPNSKTPKMKPPVEDTLYEKMEITDSTHKFFNSKGKVKSSKSSRSVSYTAVSSAFPGWK